MSTIARIYDPMGFLAPVIFTAKTILQLLWLEKIDWDDRPPTEITSLWIQFVNELPTISQLSIPRRILYSSSISLEIFGFCDASEKGYAAVLYLREVKQDKSVFAYLLKAKTKLAPLKTQSIQRLELLAAWLLVKLMKSIKSFLVHLALNYSSVKLFSDSMIFLSWLRMSPLQLKIFVANRVAYILDNTSVKQWHHITSDKNPADIPSRGLMPSALITCQSWLSGPPWLLKQPIELLGSPVGLSSTDVPELKPVKINILTSITNDHPVISCIEKISSFSRLLRVMAYVLRFCYKPPQASNLLSTRELKYAQHICTLWTQRSFFSSEFDYNKNQAISQRLKNLATFCDEMGILRVGGRLANAHIPESQKKPILLPADSTFTFRIIDHYHVIYCHLGAQSLHANLQRYFWIIHGRSVIKSRIFKCLRCHTLKAKSINPFMADLPSSRVNPGRPFSNVGVDYAGPFMIKSQEHMRKPSITKGYLCVFVCMATKAVHLEAVTGLSSELFLATFDRFVSRRGLPNNVYSDNGTNFVGAARQLNELFSWLNQRTTQEIINNKLTLKGIQWHFNPPYGANFGGLWEAAVKSAKSHLVRVLGLQIPTFEEFTTLLCKVEAILNSRPLVPLSNNIDNFEFLTPGHFLVGAPLTALPEKDLSHLNQTRLSRWQLIKNATQHFWRRWSTSYLNSLQQRNKWTKKTPNIGVGTLVLIKEPQTHVLDWRRGRVINEYPGKNNVVRVVQVKTTSGECKRPVNQLVPLLID